MNVEIAQRLAELRREKGYSQEELAEEIGLSRQAVSKWERAESSPDTGNLIALAKLYGVTLDELLRVEADIDDDVKFEAQDRFESVDAKAQLAAEQASVAAAQAQVAAAEAKVAHAKAAQAQAQVSQTSAAQAPGVAQPQNAGAHQSAEYAQVPASGASHSQQYYTQAPPPNPSYVHATEEESSKKKGPWLTFPYPILCVIVFLFAGFFWGAWHPAWVVYLTIPLYYWIAAIIENDPNYRK